MRNLVVLNRGLVACEGRTCPDMELVDAVFDPVGDTIVYVLAGDGLIEVAQVLKSNGVAVLALFPAEGKVLLVAHFADMAQVVLVLDCGDIMTAQYDSEMPDPDTTVVEIVGSVDAGLRAAAWSPDEETLAVVTASDSVVVLLREFEPISEKTLSEEDVKTGAAQVSVGWGSRETQFQGRGFKAAERAAKNVPGEVPVTAQAGAKNASEGSSGNVSSENASCGHSHEPAGAVSSADPTVSISQRGTVLSHDTGLAAISWRGDAAFFCISTLEPVAGVPLRVVRVFSREGALTSVAEPTDGLESATAWKPQGAVVAAAQRRADDGVDVVFLERNGLRHGGFPTPLPAGTEVRGVAWLCDSSVLALHLADRVQWWTVSNYHWALKHEEVVTAADDCNEVVFVRFHPDKPLHAVVGTSRAGLVVVDLAHKVARGPSYAGVDNGTVAVIDGSVAKITPLAIANVPPPMSYWRAAAPETIADIAVARDGSLFAMLGVSGAVHLASTVKKGAAVDDSKAAALLQKAIPAQKSVSPLQKGVSRVSAPALQKGVSSSAVLANPREVAKQVSFVGDDFLVVAVDGPAYTKVIFFDVRGPTPQLHELVNLARAALIRPVADFTAVAVHTLDGAVHVARPGAGLREVAWLPLVVVELEVAVPVGAPDGPYTAFGRTAAGKLYANDTLVASGVTSLAATNAHVVFTTQTQLCFVPLDGSYGAFSAAGDRTRTIDRGSVVIQAMPSRYAVVLQAPRGNLETVCPRIMVLAAVRKFISDKNYSAAFSACRKNRVDLDLLHDYDPAQFAANVDLFVDQIPAVASLDLFVSCLREEDVAKSKYAEETVENGEAPVGKNLPANSQPGNLPASFSQLKVSPAKSASGSPSSKINRVCLALLGALQRPDRATAYFQTILTAHACQSPPNLGDALSLVAELKDSVRAEDAITHLSFLTDVNLLYTTALGIYNTKLALAVAQHSQMDPKEYLPFLQNLHQQTPIRRRFLIDDHLKKYQKALEALHDLGEEAHGEFDTYVGLHGLHRQALALYRRNEGRFSTILGLYAAFLYNNGLYSEAGLAYDQLGDSENALDAYIAGRKWKEALALVLTEMSLKTAAERLVAALTDDNRFQEAAEVEERFLGNIELAVGLYCRGYRYDSAILAASHHKKPDLLVLVVDPQLGDGFGTIAELLADCKGQIESQLRRLRELRAKKSEDPYAFYGISEADDLDTPDNVSVAASETSTTPSFFTRYTGKTAGTAKTGASRKTSKNKKREDRKRAKGRKGTIYEEEYLVQSVGRLVDRLDSTEADAVRLIEGLLRRRMREQAYQLQTQWVELVDFLKENVAEIYEMSEKDRERVDDEGRVYLIDEIPRPKIREFPRKSILDY